MKLVVNLFFCLFVYNATLAQQAEYYVLFEYDKAKVPDSAMAFLIKTIYSNNVKNIYLEGHCDSIGSKIYNYDLSERRVKAVSSLLIENGFDRKNIEGKVGFGKDKPLLANSSPESRQKNRRVLVRFTYAPTKLAKIEKGMEVKKEPLANTKETDNVRLKIIKETEASKKGSPFLEVSKKPVIKPKKIIKRAKQPKPLKAENFTPNSTIALPNLLFQGGRHYLINRSTASLDKLISILLAKPNIKIEIQGHVCCTTYEPDGFDIDTRTEDLSVRRAIAIKDYLVKSGISSTRLSTRGFGGTRKLFPFEENGIEKQQNRRVEVMVLPN